MTACRILTRVALVEMLSTAALPALLRSQGDTLPLDPTPVRLDSLRRVRYPLFYRPWWRWWERISVIDMMPQPQSNDVINDAEPNLAVDPADPTHLVGSAFTSSPSGAKNVAPVYTSTNGGTIWSLREIVPSVFGSTGDISEDFARGGHTLYTGILKDDFTFRQVILRSADPFGDGIMTTLTDDSTVKKDQPYVSATTTGSPDSDLVYVGFNFYGRRVPFGGNGRTASVQYSLDVRTAAPPAGITTQTLEVRNPIDEDMPPIRFAVHRGGRVYGVYYRWFAGAIPRESVQVVVVRDEFFARGANPFGALTDPSDGLVGRIVARGLVTAFGVSLGQNRLVASNLSIAVNPRDSSEVWVAWADSDATSRYTLHVRRSVDAGATWSTDLRTIGTATNPGLAINSGGVVGFVYQQLTGTAPNQRWQTHIQRTSNGGTTWGDIILADVPNGTGFMGDYLDLIAVGRTFYGVFPALNTPDYANFPQGVTFQRNVDFTTHQVRNLGNTANVAASIDPFFFKIDPPTIFDICKLIPWLCFPFRFEPGKIIVTVDTILPPRGIDPLPKNCTVKWSCPGCEGALCPGWYHIFIDDIDPAIWKVQILGRRGELVHQQLGRVEKGIVLSFRPSRSNFRAKTIGDYYLAFEGVGRIPKGQYVFGTHLEVSPYPQAQHLRQRPQR